MEFIPQNCWPNNNTVITWRDLTFVLSLKYFHNELEPLIEFVVVGSINGSPDSICSCQSCISCAASSKVTPRSLHRDNLASVTLPCANNHFGDSSTINHMKKFNTAIRKLPNKIHLQRYESVSGRAIPCVNKTPNLIQICVIEPSKPSQPLGATSLMKRGIITIKEPHEIPTRILPMIKPL
ncbi:hypothetical protein AWRI1631_71490 [Saccharomyces cerevisiae AWRI1631]|uniref:Uncharacterized protein n=2 Tax=Saccharomyces cerevisiae TaxID=4932 RepID=B5VIM3_YEAS6|nr:hypothetical protein AWRI1631_71490 [Saccharomyces cerevisiae AWRI1631]